MRRYLFAVVLVSAAACGGGSKGTTPTTPTTPIPSNRAPVITSITITPNFGIAELTVFTGTVQANDPDGDALTYRWEFSNGSREGQSTQWVYTSAGSGQVRVVVTDSRGASTSGQSNTVTSGSMTGTWRGTTPALSGWLFFLELTQTGQRVSGTYRDNVFGDGRLDPDHFNYINAAGQSELRVKLLAFQDFVFRGHMDSTGRRITGTLHNSGFNGEPFELVKQ